MSIKKTITKEEAAELNNNILKNTIVVAEEGMFIGSIINKLVAEINTLKLLLEKSKSNEKELSRKLSELEKIKRANEIVEAIAMFQKSGYKMEVKFHER
jgi:hypothetical protein